MASANVADVRTYVGKYVRKVVVHERICVDFVHCVEIKCLWAAVKYIPPR